MTTDDYGPGTPDVLALLNIYDADRKRVQEMVAPWEHRSAVRTLLKLPRDFT